MRVGNSELSLEQIRLASAGMFPGPGWTPKPNQLRDLPFEPLAWRTWGPRPWSRAALSAPRADLAALRRRYTAWHVYGVLGVSPRLGRTGPTATLSLINP